MPAGFCTAAAGSRARFLLIFPCSFLISARRRPFLSGPNLWQDWIIGTGASARVLHFSCYLQGASPARGRRSVALRALRHRALENAARARSEHVLQKIPLHRLLQHGRVGEAAVDAFRSVSGDEHERYPALRE